MPYDRQLEDKFRFFNARIIDLEKASAAHDRVVKQLAEKLGVEIDLSTDREEVQEQGQSESASDSLDYDEIMSLLEESQQEEEED
ncbi:MAG: hypothetical protein JW738_03055 [Actinobacteria bacterium]|nr:hypothetical protein [Actinomycetota bacterium]